VELRCLTEFIELLVVPDVDFVVEASAEGGKESFTERTREKIPFVPDEVEDFVNEFVW
jgi:hypothetical protein